MNKYITLFNRLLRMCKYLKINVLIFDKEYYDDISGNTFHYKLYVEKQYIEVSYGQNESYSMTINHEIPRTVLENEIQRLEQLVIKDLDNKILDSMFE